ncbi:NACHT domain-containing protein [Corallococcus terminator]
MNNPYSLALLTPHTFEHMTNSLAIQVLGSGLSTFGPGADGGRDGYFQGEAPYPSTTERWSGTWVIQSKFHAPNLSTNPQKWLISQIREEINSFSNPNTKRKWPDIWIFATNVDPSGRAGTGAFDTIMEMVKTSRPSLARRFHIWGGNKILDLLSQHPAVAKRYGHFITSGEILSDLHEKLQDDRASTDQIIRQLAIPALEHQKYTKLEQAGSTDDNRPGIHQIFVDLPFRSRLHNIKGSAIATLAKAASQNHKDDPLDPSSEEWHKWRCHPSRAPIWLIKGGPGHGKSTIGQYFCQVQRAALIASTPHWKLPTTIRNLANEIQKEAERSAIWPTRPRIPIYIELKNYAQWIGEQSPEKTKGILTYVAHTLTTELEQTVLPATLRRALANRSCFFAFDGLDEVPADIKDAVAKEVKSLIRQTLAECDLLSICTSRPQGYSGQFHGLTGTAEIDLTPLTAQDAFRCATPLIRFNRTKAEADTACDVLSDALKNVSVREIMTTPLQSHIMAVIVRGGRRPPERKWDLYKQFYDVIRIREANRHLPERQLASLLRDDAPLLKTIHNRLGFLLHAQAETAGGAYASLPRSGFRELVKSTVASKKDGDTDRTVETTMKAATERLVLISTPDDGQKVRFDIRQLQEFFAAEFLYDGIPPRGTSKTTGDNSRRRSLARSNAFFN